MAFTRSLYDDCTQQVNTAQMTSIYGFQMDPVKYYNCNQARVPMGILGGNSISITTGNMVDMESSLRGQDIKLSQCPSKQRQASCLGCDQPNSGMPCASSCRLDTKTHLNEVKFFDLPARPTSNGINVSYPSCPASTVRTTRPPINDTYSVSGSSFNPVFWK